MFDLFDSFLEFINNNTNLIIALFLLLSVLIVSYNLKNVLVLLLLFSYNPILFIIINSLGFEYTIIRVLFTVYFSLLTFVFFIIKKKKIKFRKTFNFIALFISFFGLFSAFLFQNNSIEILASLFLIYELVFSIFVHDNLINSENSDKMEQKYINTSIIVSIFNFILFIYLNKTFYFKATILGFDIGRYTDLFIPIIWVLLLIDIFSNKKISLIKFLKLIFITLLIILGLFRSIWLAIFIVALLVLFNKDLGRKIILNKNFLTLVITSFAFSFFGIYFFYPTVFDVILDRTIGGGLSETSSLGGRYLANISVLNDVFSFPYLITGYGLGSEFNNIVTKVAWPISSSPNFILSILHQFGIIVFSIILYFSFKLLQITKKNKDYKLHYVFICTIITSSFFPAFFHFPLLFILGFYYSINFKLN